MKEEEKEGRKDRQTDTDILLSLFFRILAPGQTRQTKGERNDERTNERTNDDPGNWNPVGQQERKGGGIRVGEEVARGGFRLC